jgi:alpha-ketoglutarate-dependent taurine dioxygenase
MSEAKQGTAGVRAAWLERRKNFRPQGISISEQALVRAEPLPGGGTLPLVISPGVGGLDLAEWAAGHRDFIAASLLRHGGLLFRDFGLTNHLDFDKFLSAIELPRMHYMEGATPRTELSEKVYTSTEYPSDQHIALHNELNYVLTWPMKIFFFCVTAPDEGGETPVADVRRVYERVSPEVRRRFERHGWMLVRNFGEHMSLPWQTSFRVSTRAGLEDYCRANRIECVWKEGGRVQTRQVRPAVRRHLRTGEPLWFNHVAFWHVSSLPAPLREMFVAEFGEEGLPYNTYYGDGQPIEDEVVARLHEAYRQETVAFPWRRGDLLMLDNMLIAHGRRPFSGARKILAAMGEPCNDEDLRRAHGDGAVAVGEPS